MNHGITLRRGTAVLRLLAKYGTLSSASIRYMLGNYANYRALAKVLARLESLGVVTRLSMHFSGRPASYFQLSQSSGSRRIVSELTGIAERELDQKRLRFTHFAHEDICSMLQFSIEREIPGVRTVRDWELGRRDIPETVIPQALRQARFFPDLVVGVPTRLSDPVWNRESFCWIAIEVERTRKKSLRVHAKLKTYATECGFDGLLYMIPEEVLLENYLNHFEAEVAPKALRIRGFKEAYFARALVPRGRFDISDVAVDCGRVHLSLKRWIDFMASTSLLDRPSRWYRERELCLLEA